MLAAALFNLKPGTAKTTCAFFLAAALHAAGRCVLLVDGDRAMSTLGWVDMAGGVVPFRVIGEAVSTIRHQIVTVTEGSPVDAVVIDCPQMEDHEDIVRGAVSFVQAQGAQGHAIVPIGAKKIELQRMGPVPRLLDQMHYDGPRWALLNRTSRRERTKAGKDAQAATALRDAGFQVFRSQVPYNDGLYDGSFGTWPLELDQTPFPDIAQELMEQ